MFLIQFVVWFICRYICTGYCIAPIRASSVFHIFVKQLILRNSFWFGYYPNISYHNIFFGSINKYTNITLNVSSTTVRLSSDPSTPEGTYNSNVVSVVESKDTYYIDMAYNNCQGCLRLPWVSAQRSHRNAKQMMVRYLISRHITLKMYALCVWNRNLVVDFRLISPLS